jgi:hypothetical protein
VSRQTVVVASPIMRQSVAAANADGSFHPDISSRAKSYHSSVQGSVHDRLYTQAIQQMTHQHNLQVELLRNKVALPTKPWEVQRSADTGAQSWAQVRPPLACFCHDYVPNISSSNSSNSIASQYLLLPSCRRSLTARRLVVPETICSSAPMSTIPTPRPCMWSSAPRP